MQAIKQKLWSRFIASMPSDWPSAVVVAAIATEIVFLVLLVVWGSKL